MCVCVHTSISICDYQRACVCVCDSSTFTIVLEQWEQFPIKTNWSSLIATIQLNNTLMATQRPQLSIYLVWGWWSAVRHSFRTPLELTAGNCHWHVLPVAIIPPPPPLDPLSHPSGKRSLQVGASRNLDTHNYVALKWVVRVLTECPCPVSFIDRVLRYAWVLLGTRRNEIYFLSILYKIIYIHYSTVFNDSYEQQST